MDTSADRAGRQDSLTEPKALRKLFAYQPEIPLKRVKQRTGDFNRLPPRPGLALSPYGRMRALPCFPYAGCAGFKVVERCSTPRKLLKKFDQNFRAASQASIFRWE